MVEPGGELASGLGLAPEEGTNCLLAMVIQSDAWEESMPPTVWVGGLGPQFGSTSAAECGMVCRGVIPRFLG